MTQTEVNLLDTSKYDHLRLKCDEYVFVEAFAYRENCEYHP